MTTILRTPLTPRLWQLVNKHVKQRGHHYDSQKREGSLTSCLKDSDVFLSDPTVFHQRRLALCFFPNQVRGAYKTLKTHAAGSALDLNAVCAQQWFLRAT